MDPSENERYPEDWVGEVLHAKWRLDELVGTGGVASVYAATDWQGRRVAIKLMHARWAEEPVVRERFLREGYAANRVNHPSVISATADGVTPCGTPFLVVDLFEGRSLDVELRVHGTLRADEVLDIAEQLLDGLAAAHDVGVLHRDLKPDNLLLAPDGTLRILDFGIARMNAHRTPDPRLTLDGYAMGTPGFMAPEQARGDWARVDARSDLWSVGATLFTLLTGREVHAGKQAQDLLIAAMTEPVAPIRESHPEVPEQVAEIVDRALAFKPEERFQSADAMHRAVIAAMTMLHATPRLEDPSPTLRPFTTDPQSVSTKEAKARLAGSWLSGRGPLWRPALVAAAAVACLAAVGHHFAAPERVAAQWSSAEAPWSSATPNRLEAAPIDALAAGVAAALAANEAGRSGALPASPPGDEPNAPEAGARESAAATGIIDLDPE